jgi:hypothetical protein
VAVGAQVGLTLVLAAQLFRSGYYFLPRVFLHLAVCRALLVALGGWSLMAALAERASVQGRTVLQTLALGLAVLAVASAFSLERQDLEERRLRWPAGGTFPCSAASGTLLIDVPAGLTDWAAGPNFIVRISEDRRRCGAASSEEHHVLVGDAARGDYRFSADRAPGAVALEQCGRPVVLGP